MRWNDIISKFLVMGNATNVTYKYFIVIQYTCICTTIEGIEDVYLWAIDDSGKKGKLLFGVSTSKNLFLLKKL